MNIVAHFPCFMYVLFMFSYIFTIFQGFYLVNFKTFLFITLKQNTAKKAQTHV